MRPSAASILVPASHKCKWENEQQLSVLCSHIVSLVPDGDYDRTFEATQLWVTDSGLPFRLVIVSLCMMIDEQEAAPDFKGERFADYVKSLMEASGVDSIPDEEAKSEKPKTGKRRGRPRKVAEAPAEASKKAPKGTPALAPTRNLAKEKPEPKFPAGTVTTPAPMPPAAATVPVVATQPPKVMLCGYLEQPFCDITKQMLELDAPLKEQRLGALMARQTIPLPKGMEIVLELINGRPKPGVYVSVFKDGKPVSGATVVVREYTERYEITYNGTTYKVLPPGG